MRQLAIGHIDINQAASFTEHTPEQIQQATLKLLSPSPGGRYDEYISIHRWRYCPACIQAGKSHQRLWLLPFVTACPEHECELVDACRNCGRPNVINLPMTPYCYDCQEMSAVRPAHPNEIECSSKLNQLIDDPDELKILLDRLMTTWYLSTSQSLRPHYRFSPQLRVMDEMRTLVIRLWPAAASPANLADAIETQIETLSKRWPHLPHIPTMLRDRAKKAGAMLPRRDLAEQHMELLQEDDPWWVPVQEAAEAAGLSGHILKRLIDKKLVRSKLFSDVDDEGNRHKFRMVDMNHWHGVIENLFQKATHVGSRAFHTKILMFPLDEVIRDVNKGKMSVYITEGNALSDLLLSFNETQTCVRKQQKPDGTMTATEARTLLGTYHAVVADLVDRAILKTHRKSHSQRLLIKKSAAETFNEKYILVGTLAKQHGLNSTNLAEKLSSIGINPAPFGALVNIYHRADIADINFKTVCDIKTYKTNTGRKSTINSDRVNNPRVKKLILLVEQSGGATKFCRTYGYSGGVLSYIMQEKKSFGPLAARRMEQRCGLIEGYFS